MRPGCLSGACLDAWTACCSLAAGELQRQSCRGGVRNGGGDLFDGEFPAAKLGVNLLEGGQLALCALFHVREHGPGHPQGGGEVGEGLPTSHLCGYRPAQEFNVEHP